MKLGAKLFQEQGDMKLRELNWTVPGILGLSGILAAWVAIAEVIKLGAVIGSLP